MTTQVAILDDYQHVAAGLADWDRLDADITYFHDTLTDRAALVERLTPFEVIVAMRERTPFPGDLVASLPNLRLLITTGMRNASIDVAAAQKSGVVVCGTDSFGVATAELSFALVQMCARGLFDEISSVRAGGWQVGLGSDLQGTTLGLIGLGRIGKMMAGYGQAFGMHVIAWSDNLTAERCSEAGVEYVSRDDLLRRSDFLSVHVRSSARTAGLIGAGELAQMKPTAFLINTSRSAIVDTPALLAALDAGQIAGAASDVFDAEPMAVDDPARRHPRLLTTPHIGYVTRQTYDVFYPEALEDIEAWLRGEPIRVIEA